MGLKDPASVQVHVASIASFLDCDEPLLRERAVTALGRIGRGSFHAIEPVWIRLFAFAADEEARVRLSFIWASENIAVNTPDPYAPHMPVFAALLRDGDERVRMEAPEMFRVLGKRRPAFTALSRLAARAFGNGREPRGSRALSGRDQGGGPSRIVLTHPL